MPTTIAVILAAGQGTRMQSALPKVLHKVNSRAMVEYVLEAASAATHTKPVVVVGHRADLVIQEIGARAHFVHQVQQLGTGHAVQQAEKILKKQAEYVLVLSGDMPLLTSITLTHLIDAQEGHSGPITMLTLNSENPRGFGHVIRNAHGHVCAIVEEAVATPEELMVTELNAGVYCFSAPWLWEALPQIQLSPKGEYYLTDLVEIAVRQNLSVQAITLSDPLEALGVNTQEHLMEAELQMKKRESNMIDLTSVEKSI